MPRNRLIGITKEHIATPEDFAVDGVVPKTGAARRTDESERYQSTRRERLEAEFDSLVDNFLEGDRVEEFPKKLNKQTEVRIRCGCEAAVTFSMSLSALERFSENHGGTEGAICPRCPSVHARKNLARIIEEKGGTVVEPMTNFSRKMGIRCAAGHTFRPWPGHILYKGTWCPECATTSTEGRYAEILAERGWTLVEYRDSKSPVVARRGEEVREFRTNHLSGNPPMEKESPKRGERYPLRVFLNGTRAFVTAGAIPDLPDFLREFVEESDCIPFPAQNTQCNNALAELITEYADLGYEVLNAWGNPQWVSPGKYQWGELDAPFHAKGGPDV